MANKQKQWKKEYENKNKVNKISKEVNVVSITFAGKSAEKFVLQQRRFLPFAEAISDHTAAAAVKACAGVCH